MERVQFEQEQMLAELKDLVEKKLFTVKETKQILKQRTQYEAALVRRVAKKADFLRYAEYEMRLEELRRKRAERLKIASSPTTVSDYSLVKRQFNIFERALKRFKSDVGLWIEYIKVAKKQGARTLVGRIMARAVQLHPNVPALYILAAEHELEHLSPSSARSMLQRGIRMNEESMEMWREYVKMELGFMETVRRRWETLGVSGENEGKEVMDGSVVCAVISSAVKGKMIFFVLMHM
ncbi:U3 snoRNP protein [Stygiomarasmius scandens]|uniref:U3 snoRNP protein n=1 Tax=Marasmiellus scandens TaxID=2682957 RepID=A0ABR1K7T8_9AGAR